MGYSDALEQYVSIQKWENENLEWANAEIERLKERNKKLELEISVRRMLKAPGI